MTKTNEEAKEQAFLLQFEGDTFDVRGKLGLHFGSYGFNVINEMKETGVFGILEALIDLNLTDTEIRDFYIHGHVDPYYDSFQFAEGIINIVHGMPKDEIKEKYGRYFNDERIQKFAKIDKNTQMLLSFSYDKDDMYDFILNKDDLYNKFEDNYNNLYNNHNNYETEKNFQKVDGKLFRAIRFLVRQGYDFPEIECITNEQIKDIVFNKKDGKNTFILNKDYAREMSDDLLSLVCFLKRKDYKFLNPENIFNKNYDNITLIDPDGKQIIFKRSNIESNLNNYTTMLLKFNNQRFEVSDIIDLCNKTKKYIGLNYVDRVGKEYSMTVKRDILPSISEEFLKVIRKAYDHGFTFPDNENLFDKNQKLLKIIDPDGNEQLVVREEFDNMLDIIIKSKSSGFSKESGFNINLTQLFDLNQNVVELFDNEGKKISINRNRIMHMMDVFSILSQYGYSFNDYNNLFDENQLYIISYYKQNKEIILNRKQINKIVELHNLPDEERGKLTDNEKNLLLMLNNYTISKKLFEWLPYMAKKWIPSSAVINKIPAEQSYKYFYNNNHARLKILKDEFKPSNYEEMEGIISIGYILGLFDSKGSTSEKAMEYIIDYFLKREVTADELHTTYGAIDLSKGYNKKFADFFMTHYSISSEAFVEPDLGTNMVGELYERFDEVLKSRPEKKIKTRTKNKLLTPIDAMASITKFEIDREILGEKVDDERYIRLIELLMKFGAGTDELKWAIKLYEQALAIDEQKVSIPHIEDLKANLMKFNSHLKSDPQAFLSGRKTNCCSRYGGFAQDRLTHVIIDNDWRYVTFTSPNRTFFDGLVWYDKEEKVVCIDNVEGQFSKTDKKNAESTAMMTDTIIRYADGIYHKMNELNIPCVKVNVGKDPGTASWEIFKYAFAQKLINEDNNPCNYPTRNNISTDGREQFTITDEKTLRYRRTIR